MSPEVTPIPPLGFIHTAGPSRIVFARGSFSGVGEEVKRLGIQRALILTTSAQREHGTLLQVNLGSLAVGHFADATMHTPVTVTEQALTMVNDLDVDGVVALGGGSTTGLGKAIAARSGLSQVVVPTTYAGSEVTPLLGETEGDEKRTRSGPEILPETVVYDPALTDGLPIDMTVTSGLNAMAHALEGLYARDVSPVYAVLAAEGLRAFREALPALVHRPQDQAARDKALLGSWLCGTVLGGVGMSLHHKLCHTLGGALDVPHAQTHAILLPHTIAYVADAASMQLEPAAAIFGSPLGAALHEFALSVGAPTRLVDLGVREEDLDRVTDMALTAPYWSPRPLERLSIRELLQRAWSGEQPSKTGTEK